MDKETETELINYTAIFSRGRSHHSCPRLPPPFLTSSWNLRQLSQVNVPYFFLEPRPAVLGKRSLLPPGTYACCPR